MGYRDELIRRFQEFGHWDGMTLDVRRACEEFEEQTAGALLAEMDKLDANLTAKQAFGQSGKTEKERKEAATDIARDGLLNVAEVLDGKLVGHSRLAPLGHALAAYYRAAKQDGLTVRDAYNGLQKMTFEGAIMLTMMSELPE